MRTLLLIVLVIVFVGCAVTLLRIRYLGDEMRRLGIPWRERKLRLRDIYGRRPGVRPPP